MLQVKRESGQNIKTLFVDNTKEYVKEFTKLLESESIKYGLTILYILQQNSVMERANRTLIKMARYMLL